MMSGVRTLCKRNVRLYRQPGKCHGPAREYVDYDLLVDAGVDAATEHEVAAEETGEKWVVRVDLAMVEVQKDEHGGLVYEGEQGEVTSVLASGFEDEVDFAADGPMAEEEDHP